MPSGSAASVGCVRSTCARWTSPISTASAASRTGSSPSRRPRSPDQRRRRHGLPADAHRARAGRCSSRRTISVTSCSRGCSCRRCAAPAARIVNLDSAGHQLSGVDDDPFFERAPTTSGSPTVSRSRRTCCSASPWRPSRRRAGPCLRRASPRHPDGPRTASAGERRRRAHGAGRHHGSRASRLQLIYAGRARPC